MHCSVEALSQYIDGELTLPDTQRIRRHLAECSPCSQELEALQRGDRVVRAWALRSVRVPDSVERRISRDLHRRRAFVPLVALSKVMPAAVGTSAAALLVLVSVSLGVPYANRADNPGLSQQQVKKTVVKQSAQLIMNRRMQAVVGIRTAQPFVRSGRHFQLDEN
jgi:anti-sigma factor RsiW